MDPNEIRRLVVQARLLNEVSVTTPEAFLLAFVAWEGFKIRILISALCADGLSVSEAKRVIKDRQIWRESGFENFFEELFGKRPQNAKHIGSRFNSLGRATKMRNSYVHGTSRFSPKSFANETERLIALIEMDWATPLQSLRKGSGSVGQIKDPLGRLVRQG